MKKEIILIILLIIAFILLIIYGADRIKKINNGKITLVSQTEMNERR